jgi:PAS domain-containing protein
MAENRKILEPNDELRALRARVTELEQQLSRNRAGAAPDGNETAAERAAAGFFEQPLVMLVIADLVEGRFLRVNSKVCEVLGYSEKELLETGEQTSKFKNRHQDADGNYRTFEWTAVADANRELCYAMAIDVSE